MHVCMVLAAGDFPPDIRVEKETRALRDAGHEVTIVCRDLLGRPRRDSWEGCTVLRLDDPGGAAGHVLRSVAFVDPWWTRSLKEVARDEHVDVLHVHDLPLLGAVLRVGLPVVADFHENYPAAISDERHERGGARATLLGIVSNRRRWESYERRAACASAQVLVVVDEARDRLAAIGVPRERIAVIENTEDPERFLAIPVEPVPELEGRFVLSYIGGFGGRHRGLDVAVRAMPAVTAAVPEALLLLVGDGRARPDLERLVQKLRLDEHVRFLPWQPFERVPSLIAASDVCLVPHRSGAHTEATSPHKLFQYMLLGKPVLVSSCRPLERVVAATGAGLVFEAGNPESLAARAIELADPALRERLGRAGRKAALGPYSWNETAKRLVEVYAGLARS